MSQYYLPDINHIKKNTKIILKKLLLMIVMIFLHLRGKVSNKRNIILIFNCCKDKIIKVRVLGNLIHKVI